MPDHTITTTSIPGLLHIELTVHGDNRGWFKENFQREKLVGAGLPNTFEPVQNNFSYNAETGVTRGIHGEPWDKYISLASGKVFCAIVDLRSGNEFGRVETFEISPSQALYVPKGCGNSFQTLVDDVVYTYLVNDYYSTSASYTHVNLFDPELAIEWPIARSECILSEKDETQPMLSQIEPIPV